MAVYAEGFERFASRLGIPPGEIDDVVQSILRLASRLGVPPGEIDDVVQDVLLRAWESRDHLGSRQNPAAWLQRVGRNLTRDHLRHVRRAPDRGETSVDELVASDELEDPEQRSPEDLAIATRRAAVLWLLISQIRGNCRSLFVEHELMGRSLEEIAVEQDIGVEAAKKRLQRAWHDVREAKARWQDEQRSRGWDIAPVLLVPVGELRQDPDSRDSDRSFLRAGRARILAQVGVAIAVVALQVCPITWSPFHPSAPMSDAGALAAASPTAPRAPSSASSAPPVHSSASPHTGPVPAPAASSSAIPCMADSVLPTMSEEGLLTAARAGIKAGGLSGMVEALRLLEEHARRFPRGRLAPEREALLQQVRAWTGTP